MRKQNFIKAMALSAVALASVFQVACTDREVAAGAVGAVVGAIIVDSAHHGPRCGVDRYETIERRYRDYWGNWHIETRTYRRDGCDGRLYPMSLGQAQVAKPSDIDSGRMADAYALSQASAEKVRAALVVAASSTDDATVSAALGAIGVQTEDLKQMAKYELPSAEAIDRIAQALNQDKAATKLMLNSIMSNLKEQEEAKRPKSSEA